MPLKIGKPDFTMILEDLVLTATFRQIENVDNFTQVVDIQACDNFTGESGKATWTKEQWLAVHLLIANADESDLLGTIKVQTLYAIAEPAIAMLPQSCRPIP